MTKSKWTLDPLGRSGVLSPSRLIALCAAIVITGSAWPIYAGSVGQSRYAAGVGDCWGEARRCAFVRKRGRLAAETCVKSRAAK
jgi:hypothetical protein